MLKRRDFLRATLVGVASLTTGCGDDEGTTPSSQPARQLADGTAFFPQSIASGDPRPDGVILWARLADPDRAGEDLPLELEVALDEAFTQSVALDEASRKLVAKAKFDGCVKVRLVGLSPATVYYYRFVYTSGETAYGSRVGRTKTAPAPDADVPVKFAVVSCQDFIGRYYNAYAALATLDLDFFVHLGDYVYETTGDPSFQDVDPKRKIDFDDEAGAIALKTSDGATYYAARSLDNYRQLYRTYRSDAALQAVHERFAMIATWDDHEFSDDCHGAVATYTDGLENEEDVERRKAANQAWFEYMPVDYAEPGFEYDPSAAFPGDIRVHRDLVFGKHLHLVVTDLRTYRADHVVPEDAFPGAVAADQAALTAALGSVPAFARPYVDIDTFQGGLYKTALVDAARNLGFDPAKIAGKTSVAFINAQVAKINEALPADQQIPPIDDTDPALERGIAWTDVGKNSQNGSIGSRYFVLKEPFEALARTLFVTSRGASETVMGTEQKAWFLDVMKKSTSTFKVWANEYCLTPLAIDLSKQAVPAAFQQKFTMNLDAWDGFPNERSAILSELAKIPNVVAITGDVHAFYAATPHVAGAPDQKIVELVTAGVSSKPFAELLQAQVKADPTLSTVPGAALLASLIDGLFLDKEVAINPHLGFANSSANGFSVAEITGTDLTFTFHQIEGDRTLVDSTGDRDVAKLFETQRFRVKAGEAELYKEIDGAFKRWDPGKLDYV